MTIDKLYIACCKKDFYLTRICVASIRYWNQSIPIELLKDLSQGAFDTSEIEQVFSVSLAPLPFKNVGAYSKLYPFINPAKERALILDSDIVWLGDLIPELNRFDEDVIADCVRPADAEEELNRWYIDSNNFSRRYGRYPYPGFVFNTGQLVISTHPFSAEDFTDIIDWTEPVRPLEDHIFLCEDQGIINYVVAKKLKAGALTLRPHHFFVWGWSEDAKRFTLDDILRRKGHPFLLHWFGRKEGMTRVLPRHELLQFYERWYYQQLEDGMRRIHWERLKRTVRHPYALLKAVLKFFYYRAFGNFISGKDTSNP